MLLELEKQRLAQKYTRGSWRYYLHLWARSVKSIYHRGSATVRIEGHNNYVPYIPPGCRVYVFGENNIIDIDPSVTTFVGLIHVGEADLPVSGCRVWVGKGSYCGGAQIMLYENNSTVHIGEGCMFSFGIEIWASDSHSIINAHSKKLLNWGKEIFIGDRVWIGMRAIILKNSYIGADCVVGAGSVVAGEFKNPHCILAGNPARVVKEGISWDSRRPVKYQKETVLRTDKL